VAFYETESGHSGGGGGTHVVALEGDLVCAIALVEGVDGENLST
jgi:hypothetical protein